MRTCSPIEYGRRRLDDRAEVRTRDLRPSRGPAAGRAARTRCPGRCAPGGGPGSGCRCRCRSRCTSGRRWRCARLMITEVGRAGSSFRQLPLQAEVARGAGGASPGGASRRTPDGFAGTRREAAEGSRAATGPADGGPRPTARTARGGPPARTDAQKSTSSVYRKNRSSSSPTASASARHTSRHAPLTQSTSCAVASDRSTRRRTGTPAAIVERARHLLPQFVERADHPAERQLRPALGVHQSRAGDRRLRMRAQVPHEAVDGAGRHLGVAVQQQHEVAGGGPDADVVRLRESEIRAGVDGQHVRVCAAHQVQAAVRRPVVHDDHLVREGRRRRRPASRASARGRRACCSSR